MLVLACLALLAGCGKKDDQINSFISDVNSFTDELVKKVDAAPNPSQGLDDAQNYLDSRKSEIKGKFDSIKNIGEKLQDNMFQDGMKVGQLTAKYGSDPELSPKVKKLTQDFQDLFKM
jgi:outer membrane murein-binding lipoprotein Lpp